jgi:hypothetical protein
MCGPKVLNEQINYFVYIQRSIKKNYYICGRNFTLNKCIVWTNDGTLKWKHAIVVHFEQENVLFWGYFLYIILGVEFPSFHSMFWETHKIDFWHKASNTNLVTFQIIVFFQQTFMYSHIYVCLNGKPHPNVFHEITWVELFI